LIGTLGPMSLGSQDHATPPTAGLQIIVVTGVQGAGKTTVARILAERFPRAAHVEADALQRMIVSGGAWVSEPGMPSGEAARQLRLRLANLCMLGVAFYEAGFTAILDDLIMGDRRADLDARLAGFPSTVVVLAPSADAVDQRDRDRAKRTLGRDWFEVLDRELRAAKSERDIWVDTSQQTPNETVAEILERLDNPGLRQRS
jgi:chloramphenicol 3-O-phosphotransferase